MSASRTVLRLLACLAVLLALCAPARADTAISLWKSFNGAVNFTGTQVTLRNSGNNANACSVASSNANRKADLVVPAGATILSAQLYWAGSGAADNTVTFQGNAVSAERKYTSATVGNGMNYFSGVADVTAYVKGSGTYTFSGLTVANGNPWCASQAVLGGFSLLVVYSHPNEPERVLNLYEGFRYVQNGEISFTANNFRWPRPWWPVVEKARIGHITWEGDATLAGGGERLIFDGKEMTDDMNPAGNQFNSQSNINRDYKSYGIDFDAYDTEVVQWIFFAPSVTTTSSAPCACSSRQAAASSASPFRERPRRAASSPSFRISRRTPASDAGRRFIFGSDTATTISATLSRAASRCRAAMDSRGRFRSATISEALARCCWRVSRKAGVMRSYRAMSASATTIWPAASSTAV